MTVDAERAAVLNAVCTKSFDAFAQTAFNILEPGTTYEWNWHVGCISEYLEALHAGEISRLIINLPPRSLKSYLVSVAFPAWVLAKDPFEKFIVTSYSHELALILSQNCRSIVASDWYRQAFPGVEFDPAQNQKHHWKTTQRGQYYAASAQGAITGVGCKYLVIDDPIKPNEALSDTIRQSTNENIRNTLFSRFDDKRTGKLLMVMQRTHDDDPTGNLLKDGGYTHLKLPGEAKRPHLIALPKRGVWTMKEGELLFPARVDREILDQMRVDMGDYNYSGQILQEPVPIGGGEFREEWPQYYKNTQPKTMNLYILCDPAGGEELQKRKKKLSDRTTMMVIGLAPDNNYYWLDGICDRLNPTERVDTLFDLHRKWNELTGKPPVVGYEHYSIQTDTHYIRKKQEETGYRFNIIELGGGMSKNERIRRMIPDMQRGRWWFPYDMTRIDYMGRSIDLVREMVKSEMPTFPKARYDDMLDAMTRIYDEEIDAVFPRLKQKKTHSAYSNYDAGQDWISA